MSDPNEAGPGRIKPAKEAAKTPPKEPEAAKGKDAFGPDPLLADQSAPRDNAGLRTDGPTLEEFIEKGYMPENYPPQGWAEKPSEGLTQYRAAKEKEKPPAPIAPAAFAAASGMTTGEKQEPIGEDMITVQSDHAFTIMEAKAEIKIAKGFTTIPARLKDHWSLKAHRCKIKE